MRISTRFTMAIHVLIATKLFHDQMKVTSELLGGSTGANPVIIRNLTSQLQKAGLISVARGTGGAEITKPLSEISFYDVYTAVEDSSDKNPFHFHENPNPECPVGRNIHDLLDGPLEEIQESMKSVLKQFTLDDIYECLIEKLNKEDH